MESFSSASYSKLDDDRAWSSQEWKTETKTYDTLGRLMKLLGEWFEKFDLITKKLFSTEPRNPQGTEKHFVIDQGDLIISILKKWQDLKNFVMGNDGTELELSVESRSFVNRVNDQVRKRQKRFSSVRGNGEEHFMIWGMFMAVTVESATFMGKNFQNNRNSDVNTADLTLKQMFDTSTRLVLEQ